MNINQIVIASFTTVLLSGCSIAPLYQKTPQNAQNPSNEKALTKFSVTATSKDVESYLVYQLQKELDKRVQAINPLVSKATTIHVGISEQTGGIGYNQDSQASRYLSRLQAKISIAQLDQAAMEIDAVTSYNVETAQEFMIQNTQQAARDRLVIEIANKIQQAVIYFLSQSKAS